MSDYQLHLGDCLEYMRGLPDGAVDAVVTDPPWGMNLDTDYTRFTNGLHSNRCHAAGVQGDDKPFDPAPFLGFPRVVLWGMNHFSDRLPQGGVLVWLKKRDNQLGTFLSDAEVAWVKGIKGVYVFRHIWHGFDRESERGAKVLHPTQKPVALMRWCIEKFTRPGDTVLDPFMGSGTTGVACIQTGRNFIGVEISEEYFRIAKKRIEDAAAQLPIPFAPMCESDGN